jgi:hypothetical protein
MEDTIPGLDNYQKEKLTIDIVKANVFGILLLIPLLIIFGLPYYLFWHSTMDLKSNLDSLFLRNIAFGGFYVLGALILGIIIHELIHGVTWAYYDRNGFRSIKIGVLWQYLTPYCHCKEPLTVRQYFIGAMMPAVIMGLIPMVVAIIIGHFGLLVFGMVFTMAAAGDFLIINLIRKEKKDDLVLDHPSEAGCYIFRKPA